MTTITPVNSVAHMLAAMSSLHRFRREKARYFEMLTGREIEVLALVAEGFANPDIARQLNLARVTVQNHRASIRQKLNITSAADYIKYALAYDLISL